MLRLAHGWGAGCAHLKSYSCGDQIELPVAVITHFELLFRVECLDNFESFSFAGTFICQTYILS